ncbi:MAG: transposase [Chitinophagaceae bacterium]|nr:transposase [Chitinophagaceae bacterium]
MANTFTQLHVHLVFAVKYRRAMIATEWKERLHEYISGIIRQSGHKVIQVNYLSPSSCCISSYR